MGEQLQPPSSPSLSRLDRRQYGDLAFQSQLDGLYATNQQGNGGHEQQNFAMGPLMDALPHAFTGTQGYSPPSHPYEGYSPHVSYASHPYARMEGRVNGVHAPEAQSPQSLHFPHNPVDPHTGMPLLQQMPIQMHPQMNFRYGNAFGTGAAFDPRFAQPHHFTMITNGLGNTSKDTRHVAQPAPVPPYLRGPPRKPKQSGHAMWVGNLPPAATIIDLKDFFSRDATHDIQSVFLISKSGCAFVNYRTEAACAAAVERFQGSRLLGMRIVCRLRRGATEAPSPTKDHSSPGSSPTKTDFEAQSTDGVDEPQSPMIVTSGHGGPKGQTSLPDGKPETDFENRVSERFFVLKSLTVQDLESSVRNGVWATQSKNETTLNQAFAAAENVYLIFSANKSGEYFGYARMMSEIAGKPVPVASGRTTASSEAGGPQASAASIMPKSSETAPTATAPKGRIFDDSARGTIFWESEAEGVADDAEAEEDATGSNGDEQQWGKQFSIEWVTTTRLPFHLTRGLRNPWNSHREVKIARDGTELEPSIGRRLLRMFHQQGSRRMYN